LLIYLDVARVPFCHEPFVNIIRKRAAFCSSPERSHLRSVLVRDTLNLRNTGWPTRAVDLLHRLRLVQRLLVIDCAGLDNFHAFHGGGFDPHDCAAGCTVVVCDILMDSLAKTAELLSARAAYLGRIAFTSERAVGAGELFVLWTCQMDIL